jgi:Cdc6-like AAA superfamily ATPase
MDERRVNPFCPNGAIAPGMFAGRLTEIEAIETSLIQAKGENSVNLLITGERGIGKTSLLQYAEVVAEGRLPVGPTLFRFLISSVSLTSRMTRKTLIKLIEREIGRKLSTSEKARSFLIPHITHPRLRADS